MLKHDSKSRCLVIYKPFNQATIKRDENIHRLTYGDP